jgi:hypothetical protein
MKTIEDTNMGTGYCTYILHSNPNRAPIVVPKEYDRKAKDLMNLVIKIESRRKNSPGYELLKEKAEDLLYLTICMSLADDDVKYNENEKKQEAIYRRDFFKTALESL